MSEAKGPQSPGISEEGEGWTLGAAAKREEPDPAQLAVEPAVPIRPIAPPDTEGLQPNYEMLHPPTSWRQARLRMKQDRALRRKGVTEETGDTVPGWLSWPMDLILMVGVAWLALLGITTTYQGYGHSWDEALYLRPGQSAWSWVTQFVGGDRSVLSRESIQAHWGERMEDPLHPEIAPIPKLLVGLGDSGLLTRVLPGTSDQPLEKTRLPHALLFAGMVALVYLIAAREGGRYAGLLSAIAVGMAPRVFGHGHIAASETALLFFTVLMVGVWQAGMRQWVLGLVLAGPVMGLLLTTKVTAAILPLPLMVWALVYRRKQFGPAAFSLMFLAPATLLAVWPWLWHDTVARLAEYAQFYARHQSTAVWYLGRPWGYIHGPAAPWHYPLAMLGAGLPEWVVVLALAGCLRALWGWRRRPVPVLWLLAGLAWLILAASPAAPKYDGDRLFLPVVVFMGLLAGHGFAGAMALIFDRQLIQSSGLSLVRVSVSVLLLALFAGWGYWELRSWSGAHLNYFNRVVGGAKGAQKLGFETTYWGEALDERAISWLRDNTRETSGARVQVLALNPLVLENLQDWGMLPADIRVNDGGPMPVDWYVIQAREGFHGRLEKAVWSTSPALELESGGVVRLRIVDGQKFFAEREEATPVGKVMPALDVAIPPPPVPVVQPAVTTATISSDPVTTGSPVPIEGSGPPGQP